MSKNDEIEINLANGKNLGLKRENSEKRWFETMVEREIKGNTKQKQLKLRKDNSVIKPPNVLSNKEQDFLDNIDLFNVVSVPSFSRKNFSSRLSHKTLPSIDLGKKESSMKNLDYFNGKINYEKLLEKGKLENIVEEIKGSNNKMEIENDKYEKILIKSENKKKIEKAKTSPKLKMDKKIIHNEKKNSPIKNYLHNLLEILKTIFKNKKFNEEINLDKGERKILKAIVERKYKEEIENNKNFSKMKKNIFELMNKNSKKRPEENYKFIFKLCLKNMKEELKKKIKKPIRKKEFEKYFYDFYFKEISENEAIPIEHFHHPKNSKALKKLKAKSKDMPKTINQYYIENISKSKPFLNKFLNYLNQNLLLDYEKSIDSKLEGLVRKWENSIFDNDSEFGRDKEIDNICCYMKKNKKCKLPWNIKEIQEAIKSTKNLFR